MNDKHITDFAKKALDEQVERLNSDTLQRLRMAREQALEKQNKNSLGDFFTWKWLSGAGAGLAIAGLFAFMIVPKLTTETISPLEDLELLTAEVEMELVDDLEFYQWLDESLAENTNES